jgi:hypothetical protein
MAAWEIRIGEDLYRDTALIIETPAGERTASIDPYESSAYNAPLDIVRGVTLSDLGRVLRPSIGCWQLEVSRDAEEWFDLETANIAITLRPAGRRFELEFTYLDGVRVRDEDDEAASRRLASYLSPLVRAQRATIVSVDLHESAIVPPWPYVIVLSVPRSGWTVEKALHLVDSATTLLRAVGAGAFSRDVIVQVLRAGHPGALLGQPESICLDVKGQHYDFSGAAGKISLAQDVARFANAEQGGVLVIGMRGRKVPGGEVISAITPVAVTGHDVRRYTQVIEAHLFPLVDGLEVFSVKAEAGGHLLAVSVPPQPEELKPFLVHGAIVEGQVEGAFVSIVRRRGEHSVPITAPAIHAMLSAGRALLRRGQLSDDPKPPRAGP